jgi:hypothetical protein
MTARTQNPYAAPASEVRDDASERQVLSRAGRALLWLAVGGNLLMAAASIHAIFVGIADGYWHWPNAIRLSLAALNIAALFKRSAAVLLWLSAVPNALFAVAVALSIAALIAFRDGMAPDAAELAQAATMRAVAVGLLCLFTVVTVVMNRGRS